MNKSRLAIKIRKINKNIEKKFVKKRKKDLKYIDKQILKKAKLGAKTFIFNFCERHWEILNDKTIEDIFQPYKESDFDFQIVSSDFCDYGYIEINWREMV